MKKTILAALAATAVMASTSALAHDHQEVSYDYVSGDYYKYDLDGGTAEAFSVDGSVSLKEDVFLESGLSRTTSGGSHVKTLGVSLGYAHAIMHDRVDLVGTVGAGHMKFSGNGLDGSENFKAASLGLRTMAMDNLEVRATVNREWSDLGNETLLAAEGKYFLQDNFSLDAGYGYVDGDNKVYTIGASYHF